MGSNTSQSAPDAIFAAGGVVLGRGENAGKIALVRRRRYGEETALPKGKLRRNEDPLAAAEREVKEETGITAKVREFAGTTHYFAKGVPKAVFYFVMDIVDEDPRGPGDASEIESLVWSTPSEAMRKLSHHDDRNLISSVFGLIGNAGGDT